jgi:glycosyltransferase involved in cell wall biosynthesis
MLREIQPDAVLAHQFGNHALVGLAAFFAGAPATYGVSTTDPVHYSQSRWKPFLLAHCARPFCAGEVAVSGAVADVLKSKLRLPAKRISVIHNGCDVGLIAARAARTRLARGTGRDAVPRILMSGKIASVKDQPTAVRAVEILRRRGQPVELWIAGHATRQERRVILESLIEELNLTGAVKLLGPRDDIPELLGECDVLLHCSRSEGFPMAIVEAMAAGVPVVASDTPGCREALGGGRTGLLAEPGNPESFADALMQLLADDAMRDRLVLAGSERVRSKFDVSHMAAGYSQLLMRGAAS